MRNSIILAAAVLLLAARVCPAAPKKPSDADFEKSCMEAAPAKAPAAPAQPRKLLNFTLIHGYRHDVPAMSKAVEILGKKTGAFTVTETDDVNVLAPDRLGQFDAILLNHNTGDWFKPPTGKGATTAPAAPPVDAAALKKSLLDFVRSGKGVVGVHAATDSNYNWPEYGQMLGAFFRNHPFRKIVVRVESPQNPVNAAFLQCAENRFEIEDEIYTFKDPYSRQNLRVLLSIDVEKSNIQKGNRADSDYALSWIKPYGNGRVFYCAFGHDRRVLTQPMILQHLLAGIQYALGDLKADDSPSGKASAPPVPDAAKSAAPPQGAK